jgi:hypothetical protein
MAHYANKALRSTENHEEIFRNRVKEIFMKKLAASHRIAQALFGFIAVAVLLMSCSQSPQQPTNTTTATENFMLALQGEQSSSLQSQAFGEALPNGNYLCVERIRGGKALGLILQGNTYWVAMSYDNGHFFNWQQGDYGYVGIQANPNYHERLRDFRRLPTVLRDSGTMAWLSGPMTAWYRLDNTPPVQFEGQRYTKVTRTGDYSYRQTDYGEIRFRVWDTDVDCSQINFNSFGGSW